jgi:hypothetical protein
MAINSSRRKDEAEKDDRDDNVDALRRLIDGLQPAIVRLEADLEELLEEDEIDHEEIPAGIKETGHAFINDLIKAASGGGMEERNVRKLTNKLKLLYSKLERENTMLGQIGAHKARYRVQSNDREDKLVKRIEEEAKAMDIQLQALITGDSSPAQPTPSKEPAGSSKEHAAMPSSQIHDVTNQEEEEEEQHETAQEQDTMDLTTGSQLSPRRPKPKRPSDKSPSSLQKETKQTDPMQAEKPPMSPTTGEGEEDAVPTSASKKKKAENTKKPGKHNATNVKRNQQHYALTQVTRNYGERVLILRHMLERPLRPSANGRS